jgi:NAD(P)-dependent dehydrogenase (short-subunit alcohol dehydrogenase family)
MLFMLNQFSTINHSSVFVVSGGARGITAQCVLRLAQDYPCKWILLGRSPISDPEPTWAMGCTDAAELKQRCIAAMQAAGEKPTPVKIQKQIQAIAARRDIQTTLQLLASLGRTVEYLSADVTDLPGLQRAIAPVVERLGMITGIIHGAGTLADKLIENKTEQDFEYVYAAKVKGLENLLACVNPSQLSHLVLFSSVAGFYGSAGQADYAIANEILNKSALRLKQLYPACHVVSINWGPWDSGMVTAELKQAFRDRQIEIIPLDVGADLFVAELAAEHHNTAQVVIGSALLPQGAELDAELKTYRIHRYLSPEDNLFLQDHVIGGNSVLPATCAAGWLINTCERLYPGYRFFTLENFKVLKGIVFDQTQPLEYVVDVQETAKINTDGVVFDIRVWSEQEAKKIRFHYSGQVILRRQIPPSPAFQPFNHEVELIVSGSSLYHSKTLFHGSLFQGIQKIVNTTADQLTMQCFLPTILAQTQGQFPIQSFNPYTGDVLLQSILVWLRQVHQIAALPLEIQNIVQFKTIPFDQPFYALMEVQSKTETEVVANITAYDENSQVYTRLAGVKMTISDRLGQLFERPSVQTVNF